HVFCRLADVTAVLAIDGDTVAVYHLEQRYDHSTDFLQQTVVMIRLAAHARQPFKKITVRNRPFPAALTAENTELLPRIVRERLLPFQVVPPTEWMLRVKTFLQPGCVGGINKVGVRIAKPFDSRQVLRSARQFQRFRRTRQEG